MSVNDAEPGDIYADANGKLWRILSVYREPTVEAEEVEGTLNDPNVSQINMGAAQAMQNLQGFVRHATIDKRKLREFMSATVWFGWERIFRRLRAVTPDATP